MSAYTNIRAWAAAAVMLCGPVHAQEQVTPEAEAGADADVGPSGGQWSAQVRGAGFYTDNFFYQPTAARSVSGWLINPHLGYLTETERLSLTFNAAGEYGSFDVPGTADDYVDGNAGLVTGLQATTRNRLELLLDGRHGHDPFGIDRTESAPPASSAELDQWNQTNVGGRYKFGTFLAPFNAEVDANKLRRHYVTNRASSEFLDYSLRTIDGTLYYNFSPKTSALVEFSRATYDFDFAFGAVDNRSGQLDRTRVGLRWLASAKTEGDIRVGHRRRSFDSPQPEITGFDWDARVLWRPTGPSVIGLRTGRSEEPSYLSGVSAIDVRRYAIEWEVPWTALFKSELNLATSKAEFVGNGRRDTYQSGTLDLEYRLSDYVSTVANATVTNRSSTFTGRDYDRFSSFVGVRIGR